MIYEAPIKAIHKTVAIATNTTTTATTNNLQHLKILRNVEISNVMKINFQFACDFFRVFLACKIMQIRQTTKIAGG